MCALIIAARTDGYDHLKVYRLQPGRSAAVDDPIIIARDVSYQTRAYRSFQFVSFSARPGAVHVLFSSEHGPARDLLLAVAGRVRPVEGSLSVCGVELARTGASSRRRRPSWIPTRDPLPRGIAGIGVFERVAEVAGTLTVAEAVQHEARLRMRGGRALRADNAAADAANSTGSVAASAASDKQDASPSDDVLSYLAHFGLATASEQRVERLDAQTRARLSLALACVGAPRVALVDLTDPFVAGLSSADAVALAQAAQRYAEMRGIAVLVATSEVQAACAAPETTPLDMAAAESLDAFRAAEKVMA